MVKKEGVAKKRLAVGKNDLHPFCPKEGWGMWYKMGTLVGEKLKP